MWADFIRLYYYNEKLKRGDCLEALFKENCNFYKEKIVRISDRFDDDNLNDWTIKPMSQMACEKLLLRCNKNKKKFETLIILESVISPDLSLVDLQSKFNAIGEENLLLKMLLSGEYEKLRLEVEKINGGGDFIV